jgi:hypothetical protein
MQDARRINIELIRRQQQANVQRVVDDADMTSS